METERFEALMDAIIAIIITLIVMEFPFPKTTTIPSLLELYPQFVSYTLSFIICYNFWNYHHNIFGVLNKINSRITWMSAISIMVMGLLPHLTIMVSENFHSFTAQALFGLIFIITNINVYIVNYLLLSADKGNIALHVMLKNYKKDTVGTTVLFIIGYIIGYFLYPPAIMLFCLLTMIGNIIKPMM
ncbi:MAG: DUF1211 domain-containing protein [Methanosphaera stadtmanae]|nr:DUF1211 domain-containing protein [Methanosphaera stadtmanae]